MWKTVKTKTRKTGIAKTKERTIKINKIAKEWEI